MAHVEVSKLSQQEVAQLASTYAALILHDDGQDITADKLNKLIVAAGVKIESYWPKLFAKALEGKDVSSFFNFGGAVASSHSSGSVAASEPVATPAADAKKGGDKGAAKKQQKKPEPPKEEEEDVGMGGLFD